MRGETAGELVLTDWRRQCLYHGNGIKTRRCSELSYGCLPFGASVAVQTDHGKHLRLAVCMTFHTVCASSTEGGVCR